MKAMSESGVLTGVKTAAEEQQGKHRFNKTGTFDRAGQARPVLTLRPWGLSIAGFVFENSNLLRRIGQESKVQVQLS